MPLSPCGSPLPLHFLPHAMEEQRAPWADGRMRTMPRCFTLRSLCKEPSWQPSPGTPGCGGMGTAGGFTRTRGQILGRFPSSRGGPWLQCHPRAPLIPISTISAPDAHLGRGCFLILGGFILFPLLLLLLLFLMEEGGNVADSRV